MNGKFLKFLLLTIMVVVSFVGCSNNYDNNVLRVRNGVMNMNPNVIIGDAFDYFFVDGEWKFFRSIDDLLIVEFNGECNWYNSPAKMKVQFELSDNNSREFNLYHLGVNGITIEPLEGIAIIEKILDDYQNTHPTEDVAAPPR